MSTRQNKTETIIEQQKAKNAIVKTASEFALEAVIAEQLATAKAFSLGTVLGEAAALEEAHRDNDAAQAQGISNLHTTLGTTNVGLAAVDTTIGLMGDCAIISEALGLEAARHNTAIIDANQTHTSAMEVVANDLKKGQLAHDEHAAHNVVSFQERRGRRDRAADIAMDAFVYEHEKTKAATIKAGAAAIHRASTETKEKAQDRSPEFDLRGRGLEAQQPELEAAKAVLASFAEDVTSACDKARVSAIRDTKAEGEEAAEIADIEWTGGLRRLESARDSLAAELEDLLAREEALREELVASSAELKELNTAAVKGVSQ